MFRIKIFINKLFFLADMKVAILYSGGKDSTFAIDYAMQRGWKIEYLLSVKPTRKDCFLFHYATVEHTKELAKILGIRHILTRCGVADSKKEADIVKKIVSKNRVDAVVLGGTGLQMTQIKSIQDALRPLKIEAFAAHAGQDHDGVMEDMIKKGYKIMITQIASDGLNEDWLGKVLDKDSLKELFERSLRFGFHTGGEGGYYDTLVLDGPLFNKKLEIDEIERVMEDDYCGHVIVKKLRVVNKVRASL